MNQSFRMFPDAASRVATEVDYLSWTLLGITTLFSVGIALAIVVLVMKYWHTREVNRVSTASELTHWIFELSWSIGPLIIMLAVFAWGVALFVHQHRPPEDAIDVYVVGKQWMWKVSHQSGRREINSLHVPTGQPVRLTMISEDVIHSFFVPAFRVKKDVLPGRYATLWFEPTRPGVYHLFCAEYCGTSHSDMIGEVVVQSPEEYAQWLADTDRPSLPERGRRLVESMGCLQCHGRGNDRASDSPTGPSFAGLYGHNIVLEDGRSVTADAEYIRRAIVDPKAEVRAGYQSLMPSYDGKIEPEQIMEITAYLRSIADSSGPLAGPGLQATGNGDRNAGSEADD